MKKLTLAFCLTVISFTLTAQTWKACIEAETIKGDHITKTLVMKPGHEITIRKIVNLTFGSSIQYKGIFVGGSSDSIKVSLNTSERIQQPKNTKKNNPFEGIEDYYKAGIPIALSDISYIDYSRLTGSAENVLENVVFFGILGSLASLTVTPLFCIDFKDKAFNGDRYKNWAIGGAIGMASSLTILITVIKIGNKKYHFKIAVPDNKVKVWNFKYD